MGFHEPAGHSAITRILVEGRPIADEIDAMLDEVVVDQDVHVPDMATLKFRDHTRELANGAIAIGDKLEVKAGRRGGKPKNLIFSGEVTAIEGQYDTTGSVVVVRGYDLEHRLHRGCRTKTYHNVKDSDLAREISREAGLTPGHIDDTRVVYPHVSRTNQSGYDFLRMRAGEIGYEIDVAEGSLNFLPARGRERPKTELELGENLESFFPRLSAAEQVEEVEVRSWDPTTKKPIVERTPARTDSTSLDANGAGVAARFPNERLVEVGRPLATSAEAGAVAKAVAEQIACAFAQADGTAIGDPRLTAGVEVKITKVGRSFGGTYTLTSCRHRFIGGYYRTVFTVSGQQQRTLLGLATMGETNRLYDRPRVNGVVIGEVTDAADPAGEGRVKVRLPWLSDDYESPWARLSQAGAGDRRGMLFVPEVGDEVLVAFEHGDVRSPYILGGLYNGVDSPGAKDAVNSDGSIDHRSITSREGHQIILQDRRGSEEIVVKTGDDKVSVTLSQAQTSVTVSSAGDVVIEGARDVRVEAGANMELKATGNVDIEAGGRLVMKGTAGVELSSPAATAVSGTPVQLN